MAVLLWLVPGCLHWEVAGGSAAVARGETPCTGPAAGRVAPRQWAASTA